MLGIKGNAMKMNKKQSYGFSLVELLVAMAVGMIIIGGAFSLHTTSRGIQKASEAQMDMVADARFAIEIIAYDLRHAGLWGGTNRAGLISCKSSDALCVSTANGDTPPSTAFNDCAVVGDPEWAFDLSRSIFATDGANPYASTCIPATEGYVANTDVLDIHYADANITPPADLQPGQAYVRSNFISGRLFIGTVEPIVASYDADPLTQSHQLHAYAYYISDHSDAVGDGIPSLRRASLSNGPKVSNQLLVSGVTDLQVQFGEDVNNDLAIDRYVNPPDVNDWSKVYAAKIWLVMRSDEKQIGVNTQKTFEIAGAPAATYGGQDDYRYFMVTSVINLRNLKQDL